MSGNGMYGPKTWTIGAVSYPDYMETWHEYALHHQNPFPPVVSLTEAMDECLYAGSPYASVSATNVESIMAGEGGDIFQFSGLFSRYGVYFESDIDDLIFQYASGEALAEFRANKVTTLVREFDAERDRLEQELELRELPKLRASLREINALQSSALPIGESNIRAKKVNKLVEFDRTQRWNCEVKEVQLVDLTNILSIQLAMNSIAVRRNLPITITEVQRLSLVMETEMRQWDLELDVKDRLWDLKIFAYGRNFLRSQKPSTSYTFKETQLAVFWRKWKGATSWGEAGYQIGSAVGGPWGAGIGAAVGGVAGWFYNSNSIK